MRCTAESWELAGLLSCLLYQIYKSAHHKEGWRIVKSETRRDAEILLRNLSLRLFGEKFRDLKKVKTNHEKTRLRDLSKTLPRFRDPAKIFRDPRFSRYHSPPLQSIQDNKSPKYTVIRVKTQEINGFQLNVHNSKDHSACYPLTPTLSGRIQLN